VKLPRLIKENILLKMTSLNAVVIGIRLLISFFIQRELADIVGKAGYAKVGSLRNLLQILTSVTSVGIFNGVVKYVAEFKNEEQQLQKLFSTTLFFTLFGALFSGVVLFVFSEEISLYFFYTLQYQYIVKLVSVIVPFVAIQRVFNGVVNGLSLYKKYAKIELIAYVLNAAILLLLLYKNNLDGALIAIAISPVVQVIVLLFLMFGVLKKYVAFRWSSSSKALAKGLLAFSVMSFSSTVLLNLVEIDIRGLLANAINQDAAGIWTAITFISKNYMVFSGAIFTLYVLPKFTQIHSEKEFKVEVTQIYKVFLPLFGVGMLIVYLLRFQIINWIYTDFTEMAPLFKWQLVGDFVRLAALVLMHQFLAKKLVRSFIASEIFSHVIFYVFAHYFIEIYGVEGAVIAHAIRSVCYFIVVFILVKRYFNRTNKSNV